MPAPKDPEKYEQFRQKLREINTGKTLTEEHRHKISVALRGKTKGKKLSDAHKRKIGEANKKSLKGRKLSLESRQKLSQSLKRAWDDPETRKRFINATNDPSAKERHRVAVREALNRPEVRAKRSEAIRLAYSKPEVREKLSKAHTGLKLSDESKRKISEKRQGKKMSEEQKKKLSLTMKVIMNQPEVKKKVKAALKEAMNRPETKERIRKAIRNRPDFVRRKQAETMKTHFAKLTPEQRRELIKPAFLAAIRTKNRTSIELIVEGILKILDEPYEAQKQLGPYIVDFYLPNRNLVIECDGDYWHSLPEVKRRDKQKDLWLHKRGYRVTRLREYELRQDAENIVRGVIQAQ